MPLYKPYVTDMEGFMGMGFKDILVWLRSHLAEIVFLLIVLVVLLLMGYWAWAATPRAKDSFPCSSKMGTFMYPPCVEQRALKTDLREDKVVQNLPIFHPALRKSVFLS
jgi:hypothetical protein